MDDEFSRSGRSNRFGKCTEDVRSIVDEETKQAIVGLAFASGMSESEYIRLLLQSHVHGHAKILRLQTMFGTVGMRKVHE